MLSPPTIGIKAHGGMPIVLDQKKNDATQGFHGYRCTRFPWMRVQGWHHGLWMVYESLMDDANEKKKPIVKG